jgi:predicted nucleotidyltransferase
MSEMTPSMEEVLALLKTFMERQRSEYGLISLGVFGSFARGEARSDSDVDIVFETNEPNLFRTARMRAELESLLARPVDVVRLRERMNRHLRQRILQEARYV